MDVSVSIRLKNESARSPSATNKTNLLAGLDFRLNRSIGSIPLMMGDLK